MTKTELIEALSNEAGLTTSKAKAVVKVFFDEISNALTNNDRVEIRGLWSFFVKRHKGYTARNPKTGKPIKVKPKNLPFFNCGKELKETVDIHNKSRIMTIETGCGNCNIVRFSHWPPNGEYIWT